MNRAWLHSWTLKLLSPGTLKLEISKNILFVSWCGLTFVCINVKLHHFPRIVFSTKFRLRCKCKRPRNETDLYTWKSRHLCVVLSMLAHLLSDIIVLRINCLITDEAWIIRFNMSNSSVISHIIEEKLLVTLWNIFS